MLTNATIEGLRGVGRVELWFDPEQRVYTVFGSNGVGKTKCLEALYQFLLLSNRDFLQATAKRGLKNTWQIMECMRDNEHDLSFKVPKSDASYPSGVWAENDDAKSHTQPVVFLGAAHRGSLEAGAHSLSRLGTVAERRNRYFDEVVEALDKGKLTSLGMTGDTRSWFVARAQSVNPYQKSADNRQAEIDTVLSMLNTVDQRIDPKSLEIDGSGRVFLRIEGQQRELAELSSGFTSLVKLMQAIIAGYAAFTNEVQLRHVPGIVLIDEIESHLHAKWQSGIIPLLKKLLPNTTFYIATHSPLVLAQLQEGEAYLLQRDEDGVVRSQRIDSPDRRAFADVLESAFGVDLNQLKRESLERDDQTAAKKRLLSLLEQGGAGAS